MQLGLEPRPILAVCPNPAWQQIMTFSRLAAGEVNRAISWQECGGGKGVNVARVWRQLGFPAGVAVFQGGVTGQQLLDELQTGGTIVLSVTTAGKTRTCVTVINENNLQVTELIGPAEEVSRLEMQEMQDKIAGAMRDFSAVALSGTTPPGVDDDFYAKIADAANERQIPVVLDAVQGVEKTLRAGVTLLKINQSELTKLTGCADIRLGAQQLLRHYQKLRALAITAGSDPAWLFVNDNVWRLTMPKLPAPVINAIGAGDCATAIITRRLAENDDACRMPEYFREAMACASASCLKKIPSDFEVTTAVTLMENMELQLVK